VRLILSTERKVHGKTKLNLDNDLEVFRAAIESSSCSFAYTKYLLDQVDEKDMGDYRDENGNTFFHIVLHADCFEFDTFYKCDRCSGHLDKMYFNRDPDRAHWGVRCTKCSEQRQTVMIYCVQVPVGK
jgi:DNA-directed RNA polymerase subunit RPC12/RpoP